MNITHITAFAGDVADAPIPVWMSMVFGPGILWILFAAFLCSVICWRFIFSNSSDEVPKIDRRVSMFKTFLTIVLTNVFSSILLLIVEFILRTTTDPLSSFRFDSLRIWNSLPTVIVYFIPVLLSFLIIHKQILSRGHYMVSDRIPVKVASWIIPVFGSPWYILVPTSLIRDISDFLQSGGIEIIE